MTLKTPDFLNHRSRPVLDGSERVNVVFVKFATIPTRMPIFLAEQTVSDYAQQQFGIPRSR